MILVINHVHILLATRRNDLIAHNCGSCHHCGSKIILLWLLANCFFYCIGCRRYSNSVSCRPRHISRFIAVAMFQSWVDAMVVRRACRTNVDRDYGKDLLLTLTLTTASRVFKHTFYSFTTLLWLLFLEFFLLNTCFLHRFKCIDQLICVRSQFLYLFYFSLRWRLICSYWFLGVIEHLWWVHILLVQLFQVRNCFLSQE